MIFFQLLAQSPLVFITMATLLGLMVGSFLNVVIHRLPKMIEKSWREQCQELNEGHGSELPKDPVYNLVTPRSSCPSCGKQISALQNIPIFSYIFLRGKCAACKAPISLRYPFIEAITGGISGFLAWHFGFGLVGVLAIIFAWALIALTCIDFDTQLLPDDITLPLLWIGLLANTFGIFTDLSSAVIGAVAGYLSLWSVYWAFKIITGKEGMGYGDFKLLAAIGAWLGWYMLPIVILLSAGVGALVGIGLMVLARHGRNVPIPFGPYLAVAGLVAMLWGQPIMKVYLGL